MTFLEELTGYYENGNFEAILSIFEDVKTMIARYEADDCQSLSEFFLGFLRYYGKTGDERLLDVYNHIPSEFDDDYIYGADETLLEGMKSGCPEDQLQSRLQHYFDCYLSERYFMQQWHQDAYLAFLPGNLHDWFKSKVFC
jgi:hypothetical protein